MSARTVIAGNWKMHIGPGKVDDFFRRLGDVLLEADRDVVIFPPTLSVGAAVDSVHRDPAVSIGAQNIHWEDRGAYTGEVSAPMAVQAGATYVLVGHSERRQLFGETDDQVRRKVGAAVRHGLHPVVCVGETLGEREAGTLVEVIVRQVDAALDALEESEGPFSLAYEPVWAIGTGRTATPADAAQAHGHLRQRLSARLGNSRSGGVSILYGGSVKPDNAAGLLAASDVDGVLVGGASLDPDSFAAIVGASLG